MNQAKNQHYISQVEQRFNSHNPRARISNQRIYQFKVKNQDDRQVQLTKYNGTAIRGTLAMLDLFTFDVAEDKQTRHNFEHAFQKYETTLQYNTQAIMRGHTMNNGDIADELFKVLIAKFVNFIRNPFCIKKTINTFGTLGKMHPTNPNLYHRYERILNGRRPHQARLCSDLGISDDQYETWLRLLFMLLEPMNDGTSNLLEESLKNLFEGQDNVTLIHLHRYDTHRCLLSDRGFSEPIDQNQCLTFDFNVRADAFIRFFFIANNSELGRQIPISIAHGLGWGRKRVFLSFLNNDMLALDTFHRRVIEQARENVYCSSKNIYGASLVD